MLLKACLNGGRPVGSHPALPVAPAQLAEAARGAVAAGAGALHLHPCDSQGRESLEAGVVADVLNAVRAACPGVQVGISSGFWILPDVAAQLAATRAWTVLPDFISVNWHEPHAESLAGTLLGLGVGVEAGLWNVGAARAFLSWPDQDRVLRVLVELPDQSAEAVLPEAAAVLALLDEAGVTLPRLLHGLGRSAWPLVREAGRRGLFTRIGLEDTLTRPDGTLAADNADLVRAAWRVLASPG
ncbi:3-keto-5-aminohexanoate cleavage protein [Deinococcus apachensis]|uniref:3-keto-5-aminohexanoate cleavage protein n=1 Tax=Deinococcus apachensis TaxID=309886 RepID=UPI0004764440|nr:3-keto-5-aminohexanoate cleavage protein [Deinococcus apachensis]